MRARELQPKRMIYRTENGCVTSDAGAESIQLEYGNAFLSFDLDGLLTFKNSIDFLDDKRIARFEESNQSKPYKRKLFVSLPKTSITLAFTKEELVELRKLLKGAKAILTIKHLAHQAGTYPQN